MARKAITATLTRNGQSKAGTPIWGKAGPIKAPVYVDTAALTAAGFDPEKPVTVTITQS